VKKTYSPNSPKEAINLGGGVGTYWVPPREVNKLEDIARKEIKRKNPLLPRRRVFLSFRGADKELVDGFRSRAKDKESDLDFIDFSLAVPFRSENAAYIQHGIRERIKASSVTVVLIGETTYKSEWVDWEIRESTKLGKGVVAVRLKDDPSLKIPKALEEHGIKPLPLNDEKISQAIQEAAKT